MDIWLEPTLCPLQRYEILSTFTLVRDSAWFTGIGSVTSALTFQSILMLNRYFCVRWASSLKLFKLMSTFNCQAHKIGIIILSAGCTHTWDYIVCKWLFMVMSFSPFGLGACSWRGMFLIILYIILEYLNHSWDQMGTCLYSLFLVVTFSLQTLPLSFFIRFRWMSLMRLFIIQEHSERIMRPNGNLNFLIKVVFLEC